MRVVLRVGQVAVIMAIVCFIQWCVVNVLPEVQLEVQLLLIELPLLLAFFATRQSVRSNRDSDARRQRPGSKSVPYPIAGVAGGVCAYAGYFVCNKITGMTYIANFSIRDYWALAIIIVAFAPIIEEAFWRGSIWSMLGKQMGVSAVCALTAFGFAIMHVSVEGYSAMLWLRVYYGVIYGGVRILSMSWYACAVAHSFTSIAIMVDIAVLHR